MNSHKIRSLFIDYFNKHEHKVLPSSSLIPHDDSLLFTAAGMVPLKDYFMGNTKPPHNKLVSSQKCIRTIDIDIVGDTDRHLTFFEMLGNFSIDNYFKEDAIKLSYKFITEELKVPKEDLWYTVYKDDVEAFNIWKEIIGVPEERIQKGDKDNFWHMNIPGPCGPCSEIFIDRGPEFGEEGGPIGGGEDRYIEIWNLVFMESIQNEPYEVVDDLPSKNIDTGMGLERIAMVLQNKSSPFEIDTFENLYEELKKHIVIRDSKYERIILDHVKSSTFMISDGVVPTNEGRGYILRRIIRRAVRAIHRLSENLLSMDFLIEIVIEEYKSVYPELVKNKDKIMAIFKDEEELFQRTLLKGNIELNNLLDKQNNVTEEDAFYLFETFGFPFELTQEVLLESNITLDINIFNKLFEDHRKKSNTSKKITSSNKISGVEECNFVGYENTSAISEVVHIEKLEKDLAIFTKDTPFYYEAGGQVSDIGSLIHEDQTIHIKELVQSQTGATGVIIDNIDITVGDKLELHVDSSFRQGVSKSHTAAHIVHASLRNILGETVAQAGSSVEPGKLRFDFSYSSKVASEDLDNIFQMSNNAIFNNLDVNTSIKNINEAKEEGALAFFGDKYGEEVRVVDIGDHSKELCGGTHVSNSGIVGLVVLTNESSIGSNLRRVEMLSGLTAYEFLHNAKNSFATAASLLSVQEEKVIDKLTSMINSYEELNAVLKKGRKLWIADQINNITDKIIDLDKYKIIVTNIEFMNSDEAKQITNAVIANTDIDIIILTNSIDGKVLIVGEARKDNDFDVSRYVQEASKKLSGGASKDSKFSVGGGPNKYDLKQLGEDIFNSIKDDIK